jgi:hypothetical protein
MRALNEETTNALGTLGGGEAQLVKLCNTGLLRSAENPTPEKWEVNAPA